VITLLDPSQYRRTPWKNGAGTTTTMAEQSGIWQFGRTPITAAGSFSDYTGFDRLQVLVAGCGLVLETPDDEIDVRTPFVPVRFAGETKITSKLEAGPVEVVNLIGQRAQVSLDLVVLTAGQTRPLPAGIHLAYCADGLAELDLGGKSFAMVADHGLRIDPTGSTMLACKSGRVILASVKGI
jgi:environmental stress-induced protein Ves